MFAGYPTQEQQQQQQYPGMQMPGQQFMPMPMQQGMPMQPMQPMPRQEETIMPAGTYYPAPGVIGQMVFLPPGNYGQAPTATTDVEIQEKQVNVVAGEIMNKGSEGFMPPVDPKLVHWPIENETFWNNEGYRIAYRNLFVSMFNLLLGFAVWLMWSIIVANIQREHDLDPTVYSFEAWKPNMTAKEYRAELYTLPSIAGLAGGVFRIPNSFMIVPIGGRLTIFFTAILLLLPCIMGAAELAKPDASLTTLIVAAMFSGVGGGAFASSMNNISFFFPQAKQGLGLGLNAGIGNLGVSLSQVFLPVVMTYAAFGDYPIIGTGRTYNGLIFWVPWLLFCIVGAWFWLSDMPQHGNSPFAMRCWYFCSMEGMAYIASGLAVAVFFGSKGDANLSSGGGAIARVFILVLVAAFAMHVLMWFGAPSAVKEKLVVQAAIFKNKHTYIMTWLYIMCFGSFIGFAGAFPKLIFDLFGYLPNGDINPNAPSPTSYAFLGPLVGSLARPVGGWLSDKFGGALVTQIDIAVMIAATVGVAVISMTVEGSETPEEHFPLFLFFFLVLFLTTGVANGSTFKQIAKIFHELNEPTLIGPVLGWSSAIASFGAYVIPAVLGLAILNGSFATNMFGFVGYYCVCFVVNGWFYARPGAEVKC